MKFKPCPFCGYEHIVCSPVPRDQNNPDKYRIQCINCQLVKFVVTKFKSQVFKEWNTRSK